MLLSNPSVDTLPSENPNQRTTVYIFKPTFSAHKRMKFVLIKSEFFFFFKRLAKWHFICRSTTICVVLIVYKQLSLQTMLVCWRSLKLFFLTFQLTVNLHYCSQNLNLFTVWSRFDTSFGCSLTPTAELDYLKLTTGLSWVTEGSRSAQVLLFCFR